MRIEIHYLWVGLSLLISLSKGAHSASVKAREVTKEHSFDLGPLRCCPKPNISDVCPEVGEYVPCTVVGDMDSRKERIKSRVDDYARYPNADSNCTDGLREIFCNQNFPTCVINEDGTQEIQLPDQQTCEEKLDTCPSSMKSLASFQDICSLYEPTSTTHSVSNCSASNIALTHCTVDWYIPEWSHQYLKLIDTELDTAREIQLSGLTNSCWEKVKKFRCRSIGRCWAQGDRLEHINTAEDCSAALKCIPDNEQHGYEFRKSCCIHCFGSAVRDRRAADP